MTRPRIAITFPFVLGGANGGARMTREIARALSRAGARVTIIPVNSKGLTGKIPRRPPTKPSLQPEMIEELEGDQVQVREVDPAPLHLLLDGWRVRRALGELITAEGLDFVLGYYSETAFLPAWLQRQGIGFGFLATWQSYQKALAYPYPRIPRFLQALCKRWAVLSPYQRADVVFATSEFTRGEVTGILGVAPDRTRICHLGVDPGFLALGSEPRSEVSRLLFFGRVVPEKGILDTLRALRAAVDRGHDRLRLRVVGEGRIQWLHQKIRELGLEDRVEVVGVLHGQPLRDELAAADLAILPSHFEAFGLAFAEAQAAGLPVVAYAAGSVPEVVRDGETGWLARLGDQAGLDDALCAAVGDPGEASRRGVAGRRWVREQFTWERTAETLLAGIQEAQ